MGPLVSALLAVKQTASHNPINLAIHSAFSWTTAQRKFFVQLLFGNFSAIPNNITLSIFLFLVLPFSEQNYIATHILYGIINDSSFILNFSDLSLSQYLVLSIRNSPS